MSKRSEVWNHFKRNEKSKDIAFCKHCSKQIGCKGSSTTPLLNHLKIHKIYINSSKLSASTTNPSDIGYEQNEPSTSKKFKSTDADNSIKKFIKTRTLEEILSRCVAEDGFSINSIVKSEAINGYVRSKGFDMPKSPTTVTKCILKFYEIKKKETVSIIKELKKKNLKFSVTVDEWTDNSMNRYLNVTLHALVDNLMKKFEVYVLGLVHIKGTCNAEQTKLYVENKLKEFEIDIKTDIISSTHDAAAVMVKYGRILGIISQLCFNHGLHLSIIDVLYKKQQSKLCEEDEEIEDYNVEEDIIDEAVENINNYMTTNNFEDANIVCELEENIEILDLTKDYQAVIKNLRKIIKMIKSSSVKNNILQGYINEQEGKKLQLLLDIKTRWNSLITMLKRFLQIKDPVNKTLNDLGQQQISEENISILKELLDVLAPLEIAIKELSKNSATLLTAEGVYKFIFESLDKFQTNLSKNLSIQIKKRMDERRDRILMTLIIFLETGNIPQSTKYFDYASKDAAIALAVDIFKRIHVSACDNNSTEHNDVDEQIASEGECESQNAANCLQQQLEAAISSITNVEKESNVITALLAKDFEILTNTKRRTDNLDILFNALLTIKPTSTATERVFSIAGLTRTKIRTRLNFETFNAIIFLKYAFLKMK